MLGKTYPPPSEYSVQTSPGGAIANNNFLLPFLGSSFAGFSQLLVLHWEVHPQLRKRGNTRCIEKVLLFKISKYGTKTKGENLDVSV